MLYVFLVIKFTVYIYKKIVIGKLLYLFRTGSNTILQQYVTTVNLKMICWACYFPGFGIYFPKKKRSFILTVELLKYDASNLLSPISWVIFRITILVRWVDGHNAFLAAEILPF